MDKKTGIGNGQEKPKDHYQSVLPQNDIP